MSPIPSRRGAKWTSIPASSPARKSPRTTSTSPPAATSYTGEADEYRLIAEIVEELNALEEEAKATDAALKAILKRIGV